MTPNISDPSTGHFDSAQLVDQLNALQPGKQQQKQALFRELYLPIENALSRGVTQKELTNKLAKLGLPLSLGGFRSQLEAERKRRAEIGDTPHCDRCGASLPGRDKVENAD